MDPHTAFHRSYLDVTHHARLVSGWDSYRREALSGSINAYLVLPGSYRPLEIFPKPLQNFASVATDWERRCSALFAGGWLDPVVGTATPLGHPVVGYYGVVNAHKIAVRKSNRPHAERLAPFVERGGEAYVTSMPYYDAGDWERLEKGGDILRYQVVTDPEGGIQEVISWHHRDDSIESVDPSLILGVGSALALIGMAVGKRVILAIARKRAQVQTGAATLKSLKAQLSEPVKRVSPKQVTTHEMMQWEAQGGHTLASHNPHLTRKNLFERIVGEREVPAPRNLPGGVRSPDFRVWIKEEVTEGGKSVTVAAKKSARASAWADEATMHRTISDVINKNLEQIRRVTSQGGSLVYENIRVSYTTGSGWVSSIKKGGEGGAFWVQDLKGMTIVIRPRAVQAAGQESWYVLTAFPDVPK
ncbi:MAG: hypothetical protein HY820_25160 [Acidobacteria bacterium]|nr:hypothetical protein [Acidobacteriota bacterium]